MPTGKQKKPKKELERIQEEHRKLRAKVSELSKKVKTTQKMLDDTEKILKHLPGGLTLIQSGKIVQMNLALAAKLGYSEEEIINTNFINLFHPDFHDQVMKYYRKTFSGRNSNGRVETTLVTKKGVPKICEIKMNKFQYDNRATILINVSDLERYKREAKKIALSEKSLALEIMTKGLFRKFGHFFARLDKYLEKFQSSYRPMETDVSSDWDGINAMKTEGATILKYLELMSKDQNLPRSEVFDLGKAVNEAIELIRPLLGMNQKQGRNKIKLKKYLRNVSPAKGNHNEIREAVRSILLNAIEALPHDGEIHLTTEEHSGFAHVFIQDNGSGISQHHIDRIFDPFYSGKNGPGDGIGLSIASAVVKRHGGDIEVISHEGQGSTFIIKLPLGEKKSRGKTKFTGKSISKSHALMVLGEDLLGDLLSETIKSRGGKTTRVSSCHEAMKSLIKKMVDFLVIDYDSLINESSEILEKSKKAHPNLPIVIINAPKGRMILSESDKKYADAIFLKPLDIEKVLRSFSEFLVKDGDYHG
jgi:two-component system, sporulation sensor kinase E